MTEDFTERAMLQLADDWDQDAAKLEAGAADRDPATEARILDSTKVLRACAQDIRRWLARAKAQGVKQ